MQNFNNSQNNGNSQGQNEQPVKTDQLFMKNNPIIFFILEYGALVIANYSSMIVGLILSVIALASGYRYRQINRVHGTIMMVLALIMLILQF
ncbi:hypothetical protein [Lapidilactobacillus luobeiensis]|uniref:hypothetical protein n=1 Tax=Lapidilactobacillus luobeiensis TaxID=2950371 RepID=UPI0021C4C4AB|nr:hypothetical protein [Lapidilactobacillus luobeiensis]